MKILTTTQTKELENSIIEDELQHINLMETAGGIVAKFVRDKYGLKGRSVAVVCGRGNNGGDGFVAARRLAEAGASVRVLLADGFPASDDAIDLYGRSERAGIKALSWSEESMRGDFRWSIDNASVIIDAVFGAGFHGRFLDDMRDIAEIMNNAPADVVSIDVPSGVNADTGEVCEGAVRAAYTLTFTSMKPAHVIYPGAEYCGTVLTSSIGIPEDKVEGVEQALSIIEFADVQKLFEQRRANTYKGSYGTLLTLCGSYGMAGAAVFAGKAAVQSGVGAVHMVIPDSIYNIAAGHLIDPVFYPMKASENGTLRGEDAKEIVQKLDSCTACLAGCGLGKGVDVHIVVEKLIETSEVPLILDADALNAVADNIDLLTKAKAPVIVTPHPGEMARLMRVKTSEVQSSRLSIATDFAQEFGVYVVLKGANTICAMPDGRSFVNLTGNPGMAKAGSGDVLAGLIASLVAQGLDPGDACMSGVFIHGAAGDQAAGRFSHHGMTPMDIIFEMPTVFANIETKG